MTQQTMPQATAPASGPMPTGGRWGWYRDHEGNEWQRVSTLIKKVETDTYNLDRWRERQVGEGLAIRDDLILAIKAMGRPNALEGWSSAEKKQLNDIMRDAMAAAKQIDGARKGTALHNLTERLDRGEGIESIVAGLPAGPAMMLRSYEFLVRENGWRTLEIERTVVCDEIEAAGTFDRVDEIPGMTELLGPWLCQHGHNHAGDVSQLIVDVKSEQEPWRNGLHIGPQLAIYSRALRMWEQLPGTVRVRFSVNGEEFTMPNGRYVPAPCVRQDVGVVVHMIDGEATPYFINLVEGWDGAQAARAQADREKRAKIELGQPGCWFAPIPGIKRPAADWVAQRAGTIAAERGGQRCLVCQADVQQGATNCRKCGNAVAQVAVTRPDGLVEFQPAGPTAPPVAAGVLDEVDRSAIDAVWAATGVHGPGQTLSEVYRIYTEVVGREWGGRVAEAATGRRAQIECPQRAMHTSGKCACGWVAGLLA